MASESARTRGRGGAGRWVSLGGTRRRGPTPSSRPSTPGTRSPTPRSPLTHTHTHTHTRTHTRTRTPAHAHAVDPAVAPPPPTHTHTDTHTRARARARARAHAHAHARTHTRAIGARDLPRRLAVDARDPEPATRRGAPPSRSPRLGGEPEPASRRGAPPSRPKAGSGPRRLVCVAHFCKCGARRGADGREDGQKAIGFFWLALFLTRADRCWARSALDRPGPAQRRGFEEAAVSKNRHGPARPGPAQRFRGPARPGQRFRGGSGPRRRSRRTLRESKNVAVFRRFFDGFSTGFLTGFWLALVDGAACDKTDALRCVATRDKAQGG